MKRDVRTMSGAEAAAAFARPDPTPDSASEPRTEAVMDFPTAWAYVRTTDPADHAERCSWRTEGGAFLCDCSVLWKEYGRREAARTSDARLARVVEALRAFEWREAEHLSETLTGPQLDYGPERYCPSCGGNHPEHKPDCWFNAALLALPDRAEPVGPAMPSAETVYAEAEPVGLDVERLAAAMHKASEYISEGGHGRGPRLMHRNVLISADDVAAEYARLAEAPDGR